MVRTRRCASTPSREAATRKGSHPMSTSRVMAPAESFVCRVERTRWPVRDAWMAICAVAMSRISPTRIRSGSCRRKARRTIGKSRPMASLIGIWMMPSISYSTGSSAVSTLESMVLISRRAAYSVVVLPAPVGPVTMKMPLGLWTVSRIYSWICAGSPRLSMFKLTEERSRTRSTTDSPY